MDEHFCQQYNRQALTNLVYNGDFSLFSNKVSGDCGHPDGWVYENRKSGNNMPVVINSDGGCELTVSNTAPYLSLSQNLNEFPRANKYLQGEMVTLAGSIMISEGAQVTVTLTDGEAENSKTIPSAQNQLINFSLNLQIGENTSFLRFKLQCKVPEAKIILYSIYCNKGAQAIDYLPLMVKGIIGEQQFWINTETPPPTHLSVCEPAIALDENQTRLNSVLNGRFGTDENGKNSLLPDMRGYFIRSWDNGSNRDTGNDKRELLGRGGLYDGVGSTESDEIHSHNHQLEFGSQNVPLQPTGISTPVINPMAKIKTTDTGGGETRPMNIAAMITMCWA